MSLFRKQNFQFCLLRNSSNKEFFNFKYSLLVMSLFATLFFYMSYHGYFDRFYHIICDTFLHQCSFCEKEGHYYDICPEKSTLEGAYGRWVIPDVGVNVACYLPINGDEAQNITDTRDSAALFSKTDTTYIADHNYQGFNAIKKCEVGTVAYMFTKAGVKEYVCTDIVEGYNTGDILTSLDGNVFDFYVDGGLTNYTCNAFKNSVTVVQFAPVS